MKALITSLALLFALPALNAHAQADMRRPPGPPPGQQHPQPHRPPQHVGNQVVVDRDELRQRLSRLEKQLQEAEQRMNREERNKFRKTRELLDSVQQLVNAAPPLAVVMPPMPPPQPVPMPPPPPVMRPISEGELRRINESISRHSFTEDKMRVLNSATQNNFFLVSQVGQFLGHFQFSQDKLAVVRLLKPAILDMQNSHQLYSYFTFSSDKKKLEEILSQR
ncbi:hypothetical protein A176_001410 [Myxococcus hansupus]|uniref:DUF4476 domain-containing protein n=1 Tax=Pseudomyxococcus hansupus TaxID=1297742 RepID=A0A0H4WSH6_9BACT|nr:DUF4476 domain-containing protein [Myxococcus hansupus]AKQ64498.1 hypothetical protein A176_001410 [Myxococcus hansupus]